MRISDFQPGTKLYTQLARTALAVLSVREDGWTIYVAGVPGVNHDAEWHSVATEGEKLDEETAKAVLANRFHPGIEPDRPYAH